jgi:hypothetical protein
MDQLVFEKQSFDGINAKIKIYAKRLLEFGINKLYTDSIAYSIYFACRYKIKLDISDNTLDSLLKINDCICLVLLNEYAIMNSDKTLTKAINTHTNKLKGSEMRELDRFWLLVYQVFTEQELRTEKQDLLANLKSKKFEFVKFKPFQIQENKNLNISFEESDDEPIYF